MAFSAKKIGNTLGILAAKDEKHVRDSIKDIAKYIVESGKTSKLGDIIRHFKIGYNKETKTVDLLVTVTDKEFAPKIENIGEYKTSIKIVEDKSILGGMKIASDDFLIDASLKGKIEKLKSI